MAVTFPFHSKDSSLVLKDLGSSPVGLSGSEAKSRLERFGPNELREVAGETPLQMFLSQFKSLLVVVLIVAAVISGALGFLQDGLEELLESAAILVVVFFIAVVGFLQEYRAARELVALRNMVSPEALVVRDGRRQKIPARELVPGDVVLLEAGDKVPADLRVLEAIDFYVNEAALTGESVPKAKNSAALDADVSVAERDNMVYMGTHVTYGKASCVAVATGMDTELGRIAETIQSMEHEKTPLQVKLDAVARQIGIIVFILCVIIFAEGLLEKKSLDLDYVVYMGTVAIALAVAAVPEGLPAVVTVTLAKGMRDLVRRNAIVKKLSAVEALGAVTVICSDKTGTLTKNEMTVHRLFLDGRILEVSGTGYEPSGDYFFSGRPFNNSDPNLVLMLSAASLCNNASLDHAGVSWKITGDPTEAALLVAASKAGLWSTRLARDYPRIGEVPFSSERKRMTTIHRTPEGGRVAYVKGAPDVILGLCSHMIKDGVVTDMTSEDKKDVIAVNDLFAKDALRVLAVAFRNLKESEAVSEKVESGLVFIGLFGMIDPPREDAIEAVGVARKAGIRTVIITGDYVLTAVAVAKAMGIYREGDRILTGQELEKLSTVDYDNIVEEVSIYARVSPEHKLKIVDALKRKGHIVAMTGDGVNDAPALKKADIGIAMGITGTDVSKEAADIILVDDNFASIVAAVEGGRGIYENIKLFIKYLLSCNIAEVLALFIGMIAFGRVILTPLQILWMNLLTDAAPALALAWNPPDPSVMQRPPRNPAENIMNRGTVARFFSVGLIMALGTLFVYYHALSSGEEKAVTMAFASVIMFQLFYALSCRSEHQTFFSAGVFSNRYLLLAVIISLMMQVSIIYLQPFQDIFNTVSLGLNDWVTILVISSTSFIISELWKTLKGVRR